MVDLAYVIPAFNAARTIVQTLESVLGQTGVGIRVIVVDDGSTDETADVARSVRDWRIEVVRQPNLGLAGARDTGLEALADRAEFVCFLDADDTIEPWHGAMLVESVRSARATAGEGVIGVAGAFRMVGPDLHDLGWSVSIAPDATTTKHLLDCNPHAVGAVVLHAESLRARAGDRPFDQSLRVVEDWDLWLRLTLGGGVWAPPVHEPVFNYRLRPGALSRGIEAMWRAGQRVLHRAGEHPAADPDLVERALRHWTVRHLARAGASAPDSHPDLIPCLLADLDARGGRALSPDDSGTLLGALRHALMFEHAVGPDDASVHAPIWREQIKRSLALWPESLATLEALSFASPTMLADTLAELLRPAGRIRARSTGAIGSGRLSHLRPVLAGMGQNGRDLASALRARRIAFDWLDDNPAATCPVAGARRIDLAQIGPMHLVVVTPTNAAPIAERVRRTPALAMLPEEILAEASAPANAPDSGVAAAVEPRRRVA